MAAAIPVAAGDVIYYVTGRHPEAVEEGDRGPFGTPSTRHVGFDRDVR